MWGTKRGRRSLGNIHLRCNELPSKVTGNIRSQAAKFQEDSLSMKHFAKLALLGAALVAAAPLASAAPYLTGSIGWTDSPAGYSYNSTTNVFTLSSITIGSDEPGMTLQPTDGGGTPILYYFFTNPVLDLFSTNQPSGQPIWSGTENLSVPNDTETFTGTSFSNPVLNPTSGQISFTIYGYFTDSLNALAQTNGTDSITFNPNPDTPGKGLLTENLIAITPEPSSLLLLGSGLMTTGGALLRRRKTNA